MKHIVLLVVFASISLHGLYAAEEKSLDNSLQSSFELLVSKSFSDKATAIHDIAASGNPYSVRILNNLLEGNLYFHKKSKSMALVLATTTKEYKIFDLLTEKLIETKNKKELRRNYKKVVINNRLRGLLNERLATLTIFSEDKGTRLTSVRNILKTLNPSAIKLLRDAITRETDQDVKEMMQICIAVSDARSEIPEIQLAAINTLSGSLYPEVRTLLEQLKAAHSDRDSADSPLLQAVNSSLQGIELKAGIYRQVENIFFGLSLGSVLLLAAVGLAITFGVMGVINMAHGEMLMLGAYTTFVVQQLMPNSIEHSLFVAIPAAFAVTGLAGIGIERGIIRYLYGRPLETLLATFGLSLVLQQLVRSVFSPLNRSVVTPQWMSGSFEFNPVLSLTYNRMYIVVFALLVLFGLLWLLKKTSFGLQLRAVTQNRDMAKAMGIRTDRVDALAFGLGSGIAGVGGVALSQLTNVGPNLGQAYIVDSFMVVVFGGVGNLWGTFFGAMILGIANKFLEPVTGAVFAKILVLVFIILFIQKYPRGMFALKGRAAEG